MKTLLLFLAAIVVIAGCRQATILPEIPTPHEGWESGYVDANGIRLHYWRTGGMNRPVMILAHGITDYGLNWTDLAEKFEDEYDLIMYDARGHGFSDKPDGPYNLATHVEDLVGLIRALDIEKPILMGHSMGGGTVALAAATYPDVPRAVILEDPADMLTRLQPIGPEVIPNWKLQIQENKSWGRQELISRARAEFHPGWTDAQYDLWAESKLLVLPNVVDILEGQGFGDAGVTYAKVLVPTLILKADADEEHRAKHEEIAAFLPAGRLVHIDGAGHVIRNDRPEETEREIRAFLAGL
jgi:pimeloyl-ACP methyl ester carboxylesterase